jgi:uncharacterized protein YhaN
VKLRELEIHGFGKLCERSLSFDPNFTVVYGANEAGKSTLTRAIVASLFGVGRKEQRETSRPWAGARYATTLRYELDDGRSFEVQRDFENDPKSVCVYDENGRDVSSELAIDKTICPGQTHLGFPVEVFLNAACVTQGAAYIDGARAERISTALARALDGGPREDAALGAVRRLEEALAMHVGTKRATINAPLKRLNEEVEAAEKQAAEVRARVRSLDDLRAKLEAETRRCAELETALAEHDRRARSLRAQSLRSRLDALHEIRDDTAALHARYAEYEDVADFPPGRIAEIEDLFRTWETAEALALSAMQTAEDSRMTPALEGELSERMRDGGALSDAAFAALQAAGAEATDARIKSTFAASHVQGSRRSIEGGNELFGAWFAAGGIVAVLALLLGIFHQWLPALLSAGLSVAFFFLAWKRWNRRHESLSVIAKMQQAADAATAIERAAAAKVAAILEPLGVPSIEEFVRRRERARELMERKATAKRNAERAANGRAAAQVAARAFDQRVHQFVPRSGSRAQDLEAVRLRDSRRSARDGIELRLSMLEVRRNDVLADDDEFGLQSELDELLASGVQPIGITSSQRVFEAERAAMQRRGGDSRTAVAALKAELRTAEGQFADLAGLDERVLMLRKRVAALEAFESAVAMARQRIEERTRETHQKFARRLTDYASRTFDDVTSGRYLDVRVDPTTLAVRVRVPETGAIVDVDRLSGGTAEQAYFVVRLAMVRMFAEGLETTPVILDDPFVHWDDQRIGRTLPILKSAARKGQMILLTLSENLASAAAAAGARRIDLDEPARPSRNGSQHAGLRAV